MMNKLTYMYKMHTEEGVGWLDDELQIFRGCCSVVVYSLEGRGGMMW